MKTRFTLTFVALMLGLSACSTTQTAKTGEKLELRTIENAHGQSMTVTVYAPAR